MQAPALAYALVTDPTRLAMGRAHYSMIGAADGGIIDDLIVYRVDDQRFLVVPNASNAVAVVDALRERIAGRDAAWTTHRCAPSLWRSRARARRDSWRP